MAGFRHAEGELKESLLHKLTTVVYAFASGVAFMLIKLADHDPIFALALVVFGILLVHASWESAEKAVRAGVREYIAEQPPDDDPGGRRTLVKKGKILDARPRLKIQRSAGSKPVKKPPAAA